MLNILLIWFGKTLSALLRLSGRHGAALPGLIIEKIKPSFLPQMLAQLPDGVVIVSGTNGKTTTTKIITEMFGSAGKKVLTNKTGGNFVRGVIATIAQSASISGRLDYDIAVLEQDEAYAVKFAKLVSPKVTVLLNVTRDQLDRFGEIDVTAQLLQEVALKTKQTVIMNDDDFRLSRLKVSKGVKTAYFGVNKNLLSEFPNDEQLYESVVRAKTAHHRAVELSGISKDSAQYLINGKEYEANLMLEGQHNYLNGAAAISAAIELYPSIDCQFWIDALEKTRPAFGRGEVIDYQGRKLILQLVKNPASFRQALKVINVHKPDKVGIIISDEHADGRDVSWLWDVDLSALSDLPVFTAGTRAYDMANRLKYDEIPCAGVEHNLNKFVGLLHDGSNTIIIFATYTSMLAVRKVIAKSTQVEKI